jgi:Cof subfamily protein (haloacid dehalogenase superfamily)
LSLGGANNITARLICVSVDATLSFFMAIRMLALDLDGTLLNNRGHISERNLAAIESARAKGVRVALVTGRRFRDSRPIALELGLDVPVISHNGALTKHAETLETVAVLPLPLASARRAMDIGKSFGADALVSDDHEGLGVLIYDHVSGENAAFYQYLAWSRRVHGEEEGAKSVREVPSLEDYLDHDPIHLSFSGGCAPMKELEKTLRAELRDSVKIFSTVYPEKDFTLLDIVNSSASKGTGVAAAAAEADIQQNEIMAIGDNYNDLEMLLFAGTGVVMANAPLSLKEIQGLHPTASNVDDGVALAIDRFILN